MWLEDDSAESPTPVQLLTQTLRRAVARACLQAWLESESWDQALVGPDEGAGAGSSPLGGQELEVLGGDQNAEEKL